MIYINTKVNEHLSILISQTRVIKLKTKESVINSSKKQNIKPILSEKDQIGAYNLIFTKPIQPTLNINSQNLCEMIPYQSMKH